MPLAALGYRACKNDQSTTVFSIAPFNSLDQAKSSTTPFPCPLDSILMSKMHIQNRRRQSNGLPVHGVGHELPLVRLIVKHIHIIGFTTLRSKRAYLRDVLLCSVKALVEACKDGLQDPL